MAENKSLDRVEAFSDGVFAIAITLLVLEIRVPPIDSIRSSDELIRALVRLWPSLFAFACSFVAILISWVIHHNTFSYLHRTSRTFLYANGFLLMTVVFIPFPTALLAEYVDTEYAVPAIVFYCAATVVNSLGWFLFIRSINKPKRLINDTVSDEGYVKLKKSNLFAICIYSSTTVLAFWFPYPALAINIALWILWIIVSLYEEEELL